MNDEAYYLAILAGLTPRAPARAPLAGGLAPHYEPGQVEMVAGLLEQLPQPGDRIH